MLTNVRRLGVLVCVCAGSLSSPTWAADELARRGMMGVQLAPVTDEVKEQLKLPSTRGALISAVVPDSAAQKADLKGNDVIIKLGDQTLSDLPSLFPAIRRYRAGDKVPVTVLREGQEIQAELVLLPRLKETATEHEVIYDAAGTEGERVRTITTKPTGDGKHPAVLFIQGLGPTSVEFAGPAARHPLNRLIGEFTKAGYVVMRAERLGVGDSDGLDPNDTVTAHDIKSFRAALKKLAAHDYVDGKNVFVLSHSTGGMIVPQVVEGTPVRGVVTYATFTRPWTECALESARRRWELELLKPEEISEKSEKMTRFMKLCFLHKQSPTEVFAAQPDLKEFTKDFLRNDTMIDGVHYRLYQDFAAMQVAASWEDVDTNVLAIWGQSDFLAGRKDSEMVAEIVNRAHPGRATVVVLEGIDHMYNKAADAEEAFLAGFGGEFNPAYIETVDKWMKQVMGTGGSQ